MDIKDWDKLSRKLQVIHQSMTAYRLALCGVKPFQYLEWDAEPKPEKDSFECKFCNGTGRVEAWTGDGELREWGCPDCSDGQVNKKDFLRQLDCLDAFNAALAGRDRGAP